MNHHDFSAAWLRHNSDDASTIDPVSKQRLMNFSDLVPDIAITGGQTDRDKGYLELQFQADDTIRHVPLEILKAPAVPDPVILSDKPMVEYFDWQAVKQDASVHHAALAAIVAHGAVVIRNLDCQAGMIEEAAARFGILQATNYGRVFDVKTVANRENLAFSSLGLSCHTDNPYRDPPPGFQLLHCLENAASGGETLLVDGFAVAAALKQSAPAAYDILATLSVPWIYESETAVLTADMPVIERHANGNPRCIRFNNRSFGVTHFDRDTTDALYRALYAYAQLVDDDAWQRRFLMEAGDLVIMDNWRILHGRTGFGSVERRWLQGCYVERSSLHSCLALYQHKGQTDR